MIPKVKVGKNSFSERERQIFCQSSNSHGGREGKGRRGASLETCPWRLPFPPYMKGGGEEGGGKWEFLEANGFRSSSLGLVRSFWQLGSPPIPAQTPMSKKKRKSAFKVSRVSASLNPLICLAQKRSYGEKKGKGGGLQTDRSKKVSIYGS